MEIPHFLTPQEVAEVRCAMERYNPPQVYQQTFVNAPDIADLLRTALARSLLAYEIPTTQVTLTWHPTGKAIKRHLDAQQAGCTHKLAVCIQACESGGATIFYANQHGPETLRVAHEAGKAMLFDLKQWHGGEPDSKGTKLLVGVKVKPRKVYFLSFT